MSGYAWMHPDDEEWQLQLDEQLERERRFDAALDARERLVEKGGLSQAENASMLRPL